MSSPLVVAAASLTNVRSEAVRSSQLTAIHNRPVPHSDQFFGGLVHERLGCARDCGRRQGQAGFGRRCAALAPVLVASVLGRYAMLRIATDTNPSLTRGATSYLTISWRNASLLALRRAPTGRDITGGLRDVGGSNAASATVTAMPTHTSFALVGCFSSRWRRSCESAG